MSKILTKTEIIENKYLKKKMTATTIVKRDKSKMKPDDIKKIAEKMLLQYPKKQIMIKVLSANGYFQLKGFDQSMDAILEEEVYLNGHETVQKKEYSAIYKATFYLL
jgi:hypothetical protein